ncbi:MAG: hypothetical protein GXO80_11520 [Chlorobi bacterium]|nr:hypothetical protein [Chlorobiota bacterium]
MENIEKQIEEIDKLIKKKYGKDYISDGIVDIDKYLKAEYKILWILKEPHDKGGYENWDIRNLLKDAKYENGLNPDMRATFSNIIYASYGILNGFKLWDDIDYISENHDIIDVLQEIAFININKLPGENTSNDSKIQEAFNKFKEIIEKQIEVFKPDIIIGGNTIYKYMSDFFKLKDLKIVKKIEYLEYYPTEERVLIDAWHPANMKKGLTKEKYCDGIINAAKDWAENYN